MMERFPIRAGLWAGTALTFFSTTVPSSVSCHGVMESYLDDQDIQGHVMERVPHQPGHVCQNVPVYIICGRAVVATMMMPIERLRYVPVLHYISPLAKSNCHRVCAPVAESADGGW